MFIKPVRSNFDHWTVFHLMGPYWIAEIFGMWWAFAAVFAWELLDIAAWFLSTKANLRGWVFDVVFDKRGASWGDIAVGLLGIAAWWGVFGRYGI